MNCEHIHLIYDNLFRCQEDEFDFFERQSWLVGFSHGVLKCPAKEMIYRAS